MYLPPLTQHPDAEVVAVCGRRAAVADEFADRWNVPNRFTDHTALFDSGLIDAVVVSTSNDSHYDIAMQALDRGLHVLCEKPLALNVAQAEEIDTAAIARYRSAHQQSVASQVPLKNPVGQGETMDRLPCRWIGHRQEPRQFA